MAAHALAGSGRDRLGLVVAVGLGVVPGLSAASGRLSAGLTRAGHVLGAAVLGWVRHGLVRPCLVPVTAVGRERPSRPSAAPWRRSTRHGWARSGGACLGSARPGLDRQSKARFGRVWLGPVTAVACGLVPQASAASGQFAAGHGQAGFGSARQSAAWQGWVRCGMEWRGSFVSGTKRADGRSAGSTPAPPGASGRGVTRLGTPRKGLARQSMVGLGWLRHGAERHTSEFESLTATPHGWAGLGLARHGLAVLGMVRSGAAGVSRAASSHTGCEALASSPAGRGEARHRVAMSGMVRSGVYRRGWARHGKARETGRLADITVRVRDAHSQGAARRALAGRGRLWPGAGMAWEPIITPSGVTHV